MEPALTSFIKLKTREGMGLSPDVVNELEKLGWEPVLGSFDYVLRWRPDWYEDEKRIPKRLDEMKRSLDGILKEHDVMFVIRTFQASSKDDL